MLMAGVGRQVQSSGQRTVKVSILHEKGDVITKAVTQISKEFHQLRAIMEPWTVDQRGPYSSPDYSATGSVENGSPAC